MISLEKKQLFINKMIEAWSLLLEDDIGVDMNNDVTEENYDIEAVRQILLIKAQEGKSEKIREVLHSFNVEKLSDLDERYYGELICKVEKI